MTDAEITTLAERAGLLEALAQFPQAVATAVALAETQRAGLAALGDAGAEPWPPMRLP